MKQSVEVVEIKGKPVEVIVTELNESNYEKMARAILKMTRNMKVNQEERCLEIYERRVNRIAP
ncbi:hypothetical protein [Bacillus inaquosorum]|uniref:hypothetical protein n=1 Tax=Bacillus inaquosorum TaxID=483913 RepID=UPI00228196DE|nr:hypothetical protein [Bacillus inaquosorum]MCY9076974.1 hypothetical protein [Bacillus inaquosorum]